MANVYAWPPVLTISREWTEIAPQSRSTSMITGASFVSLAQRVRRVAVIEVSSLFSPHGAGAGYMEALKRLLRNGDLVRLRYRPVWPDCDLIPDNMRGRKDIGWIVPPEEIEWEVPPEPIFWADGVGPLSYTPVANGVVVSGLQPDSLIALPGEFVTLTVAGQPQRYMVMNPARSDGSGTVTITLTETPPSGTEIVIGSYDEGVFEPESMPRSVQPSSGDWSYTWTFREVFADEGRGPFVEVNPWT